MNYLRRYVRDTALWGFICCLVAYFAIKVPFSEMMESLVRHETFNDYFLMYIFISLFVYPAITLLGICIEIKRGDSFRYGRSVPRMYIDKLVHGIKAPVYYVYLFVLVITRKHIIQDDSAWHNFLDFLVVLCDFIWSICVIAVIIVGFLSVLVL
ncbi:MAG: hypothetical protein IJO69_02885 [Ruminiclostridium sp.]|nr:hypothetical protein [Ruminiclostridium sp.]